MDDWGQLPERDQDFHLLDHCTQTALQLTQRVAEDPFLRAKRPERETDRLP
jgi:hypothetical protein